MAERGEELKRERADKSRQDQEEEEQVALEEGEVSI